MTGSGLDKQLNMGQPSISAEGVSKLYRIAAPGNKYRYGTLREATMDALTAPLRRMRRPRGATAREEAIWALKDVSFQVQPGEVVGIIGRNGAGKSTLLKILSRITEPTSGRAVIHGRLGSLLEVGTGFHPELTGRENIYLSGSILGMSRREIDRNLDEIVAFAEMSRFVDTPVKRYSSGMHVRLAFAVAAHLPHEIMAVDEVLAVGDAEFQRKCLGRLKDAKQTWRTVLFVSHNMQAVSLLCDRALLLDEGRIVFAGDPRSSINEYLSRLRTNAAPERDPERRPGTGDCRFIFAKPVKFVFAAAEEKQIWFRLAQRRDRADKMSLSALVIDSHGVSIAQFDSRLVGCWIEEMADLEGQLSFTTPWLKPGDYQVDLFIRGASGKIIDRYEHACCFTVSAVLPYPECAPDDSTAHGVVLSDFRWSTDAPKLECSPSSRLANLERGSSCG